MSLLCHPPLLSVHLHQAHLYLMQWVCYVTLHSCLCSSVFDMMSLLCHPPLLSVHIHGKGHGYWIRWQVLLFPIDINLFNLSFWCVLIAHQHRQVPAACIWHHMQIFLPCSLIWVTQHHFLFRCLFKIPTPNPRMIPSVQMTWRTTNTIHLQLDWSLLCCQRSTVREFRSHGRLCRHTWFLVNSCWVFISIEEREFMDGKHYIIHLRGLLPSWDSS